MADPSPNAHFPRKVLIAFAALIGFFLVLVTAAVLTGYNPSQLPPSPAVFSRDLRFTDRPDGTTLVQDATDGTTVAVLPVGGEGFVRGILRTTSRGRRNASVPPETPFRLARLADGRLNLTDLGTQRVIELRSFGPANDAAFAVFLGSKAAIATAPGAPAVKTDATH